MPKLMLLTRTRMRALISLGWGLRPANADKQQYNHRKLMCISVLHNTVNFSHGTTLKPWIGTVWPLNFWKVELARPLHFELAECKTFALLKLILHLIFLSQLDCHSISDNKVLLQKLVVNHLRHDLCIRINHHLDATLHCCILGVQCTTHTSGLLNWVSRLYCIDLQSENQVTYEKLEHSRAAVASQFKASHFSHQLLHIE